MAACECSLLIRSSISSKVSVLNCCSSMSSPRNWSRIIYKMVGGRRGGREGREGGRGGEGRDGEGGRREGR